MRGLKEIVKRAFLS